MAWCTTVTNMSVLWPTEQEKRIETLATCKRLPEVKFRIAGTGPMGRCFFRVNNAETVGFVDGTALEKLIREAVFSVYPSESYENCPMSVLESQVLGTPVVGARIGGIPELIQEGKSGLLFESGNAESMSQAVKQLYDHEMQLHEMQAYCAANITLMDTDDYCRKMIQEYQSLIDHPDQRESDRLKSPSRPACIQLTGALGSL